MRNHRRDKSTQNRTRKGVGKPSSAERFFMIILMSNHGGVILSLFSFEKFSTKHLQQTGGRNIKSVLTPLNPETLIVEATRGSTGGNKF